MLAAACDDDDDEDTIGHEAADEANDAGEELGQDLADQAEDEIEGQPANVAVSQIGAILLELDVGEIEQANTELDLGTDPVTRNFAFWMRDAHSLHDERTDDLLDVRMLAPLEGGVSTAIAAEAEAGIATLTTEAPSSVDFSYLELQVKMHAAAEELLDKLIDLAPDAELENYLIATRDEIATHRNEADALLRAW